MPQLAIEGILAAVRFLLSKELLNSGLTQKEVSEVLNITPAAVTLYLSGKRGRKIGEMLERSKDASLIIKELVTQMVERRQRGVVVDEFPLILDAAYRIMRITSSEGLQVQPRHKVKQDVVDAIRSRINQEQLAAQRNMTLAVSSKDEIAKMIFRQIATDSLRHGDILSSIINYLGKSYTRKTSKEEIMEIEAMIRDEESATEREINIVDADPAVRLLLSSIDMDERKHRRLLKGLLKIYRDSAQKH